jgi:hypothetical protein
MSLHHLLQRCRATDAFRAALIEFQRSGQPGPLLQFERYSPPVKVERTLTRLLEAYPELEIERVELHGSSGCEFFRGHLIVHAGDQPRRIRFHWDCRWRAQQQGWTDYFGFPDQARAAREFGHDCFRQWEEEAAAEAAGGEPAMDTPPVY